MPVPQAFEKYISRRGKYGEKPEAEEQYHSIYAATRTDAIEAILAECPQAMLLQGYLLGIESVDVTETDSTVGLWDGTVRYGTNPPPNADNPNGGTESDWSYGFDFTTTQKTVRYARKHIADRVATVQGEQAQDWNYGGAINVDKDGSVKGVEIAIPTAKFNLKTWLPASLVTPTFKRGLLKTIGKCNDGDFQGCEKGELLYVACQGVRSKRNPLVFEINHSWAFEENIRDFIVGGTYNDLPILPRFDLKEGWWYYWVEDELVKSPNEIRMVPRPKAAHMEQLYDYANYPTMLRISA